MQGDRPFRGRDRAFRRRETRLGRRGTQLRRRISSSLTSDIRPLTSAFKTVPRTRRAGR
jgi:hypothetical protein